MKTKLNDTIPQAYQDGYDKGYKKGYKHGKSTGVFYGTVGTMILLVLWIVLTNLFFHVVV